MAKTFTNKTLEAIKILVDEMNYESPQHLESILCKVAIEGGEEAEKAIQLISSLSQI